VAGAPKVTVAIPSFNQGEFLEQALKSVFDQLVDVEVLVADAGSADGTLDVIRKWEGRLAGLEKLSGPGPGRGDQRIDREGQRALMSAG
jgi:glycosyltransferase involved in cell wall biosynthesis